MNINLVVHMHSERNLLVLLVSECHGFANEIITSSCRSASEDHLGSKHVFMIIYKDSSSVTGRTNNNTQIKISMSN